MKCSEQVRIISYLHINGWFIGYIETADSTYFFATNIQSAENATGSKASEISLSILSDMGIWKQ